MTYVKKNKTFKSTPNDSVQTPDRAAKYIVEYFKPTGKILEPCCGDGAFLKYLPNSEWCEIRKGKDFFDYKNKVDWIITNPPFSVYDRFLFKSFELSNHVVFLTPLYKALKSKTLDISVQKYGYLREILLMGGGNDFGFPFGFPCGVLHYESNYYGPTQFVRCYDWKDSETNKLLGDC